MGTLSGKVDVVTGASRGVGEGIALGLGEAGATNYVSGRTTQEGTDSEKLGGTVFSTAGAVAAMGGKGIAVQCDHRDDSQVERLFSRTGKVWVGAALAQGYGIQDIDGKQPRPITLEEA